MSVSEMPWLIELLVAALIVLGGVFALIGSWGLVCLPDLLTRLHAPTKATTLGVGGALLASMLYFAFSPQGLTIHELAITLFLFITAPITAFFVARAYLHHHPPRDLPRPEGQGGWANESDPAGPADLGPADGG